MGNNKQIQLINKLLKKPLVQKFSVLAVALVVVGSVAYFGTQQNQGSHAASIGLLSMSAATGTLIQGNTVTVKLVEDSGTDLVNAVQASVTYDATKLQYVSMAEGTAFPTVAANSTGTAGLIRVGRATLPGAPATGSNTIVVLTFKVIGGSGTTSLAYDSAFSFLVRSTDNVNTLTSATGATYTLKLPAPTITSVSPVTGPTAGGTALTISGSYFVTGSTVTIGGVPATNIVVNGLTTPATMTITATTPAHAYGAVIVVVTNPDGQTVSKSAGFTYLAPVPTITGTNPNTGLTAGGTAVTISGTNFLSGATVKIGGLAATSVTVVAATSITAITPAHAAGGVDVVVTNPDGQAATAVAGYTYRIPAPVITTVAPISGPVAGGTSLTITGSNFVSGAKVTFGTTAATVVTFVSSTSLTAAAPANASGLTSVTVTNPDAQKATLASAYTYLTAGDANNDSRVNAIDLSILISHDGQNYPPADFNGDGTIGSADLAILIGKWTW